MQGSTPQHYTIADFLKWDDDKELVLNPKFQRGPVWAAPARSYLIDSILRGYPIPKLLLRTAVDRDSRRTIRDVVDGQQRLRTIIDFANNKLVLGTKAGEYRGKRYSDLEDEEKDGFLSYKLTCEQLINATDEDVLEVFLRINSYAVPVNPSELRNARFDNEFASLVKDTVRRLGAVWSLGVLTNRDRVRMLDQSLVAEVYGFFMEGVTDGDEGRITRLYEHCARLEAHELPDEEVAVKIFLETADFLTDLAREPIAARPHFLMLVACVMYAHGLLPQGKLDFTNIPEPSSLLQNKEAAVEQLRNLNVVLAGDSDDEVSPHFSALIEAKTTTQRMRSRQTRFEYFSRALAGEDLLARG
ncbi:DUF262 domain-containing protein [Amycolatopsis sp. NPDC005961]|uniref:DUF262 domain-containing protein n=1 Tax=Amycolatopsis sp. NPDC005961 TaxID=3156720 RepID=UPI0033C09BB8